MASLLCPVTLLQGRGGMAEVCPTRSHTLRAKAFGAQDFLLSDLFSGLEKRTGQAFPLANTPSSMQKAKPAL